MDAIDTAGGLRSELEKLNQPGVAAGEDSILSWTETERYPVDGTVGLGGQYSKGDIPEHTPHDTMSLAKSAFSVFWKAMRYQVLVLLDDCTSMFKKEDLPWTMKLN